MTEVRPWYRIDKQDATIRVSSGVNVVRAAQGSYRLPQAVIHGGRFATPFAIYAREDQLTPEEAANIAEHDAAGRIVAPAESVPAERPSGPWDTNQRNDQERQR